MKDYRKLRELLALEKYPHLYIHKFIGAHTNAFATGVQIFEQNHSKCIRVSSRMSNGAGGQTYIAHTYEFNASSPDEIIEMLQATAKIPDLKVVL